MSVFADAGLLILGTRMKRLSERFVSEVSRVYKNQNIRFEPAWFPVFYLLNKKGALSLTEISVELEVSHSAVSQMITQLLGKKVVQIQPGETDARVKMITLSEKGRKLLQQVHPVWEAFKKSMPMLLNPGGGSDDFLNTIYMLEEKLSGNFLSETTLSFLQEESPDIQVVEPSAVQLKKFVSWLKAEGIDNPSEANHLALAMQGNNIRGFIAYTPCDESIFLSDVYVTPFYRRRGIAGKLIGYVSKEFPSRYFAISKANLDLIKVLIKEDYSFKVK